MTIAANPGRSEMNKIAVVDTTKLETPENEPIIIFSRTFNAPRTLVWKAVTEPQHVARWWGPRSIGTLKVVKLDPRVGGEWRYEHTLHNGEVVAFYGRFLEIDAPERMVITFNIEGMGEGGRETHTFEADGQTTRYKAISHFNSFEEREGVIATGMEKGARESWNQLDELLEELQRQK
jgi:uncharacterized protein YndB with AHSA1/START domain